MIKFSLSVIIIVCIHFTSSFAENLKDLLSETLEPISVEKHKIQVGNYNVSFLLPQGFSKQSSTFIVSDEYSGDKYKDASCVFKRKGEGETYFAVAKFDYGESYLDSLLNEAIDNVMPLFVDRCYTYWYNCGYVDGYPYVMTSETVPFLSQQRYGFMNASFSFDIYTKSGILIRFCYDAICSRFNFQYEKVMDVFKSIKIEEIK